MSSRAAARSAGRGDEDGREDGRRTGGADGGRPDESKAERLDRNYGELLQELRVTQTGTQILFAFLLTIAFSPPFVEADDVTHTVYAVTLVMCAIATALLIAPVAVHRVVFRQGLKEQLVGLSNRFALAGVYVLLVAVTGALFIALSTVMSRPLAVVVAGAAALLTVGMWLVLPLWVRVRYDRWGGSS